jgi:alkaline phosphatase D
VLDTRQYRTNQPCGDGAQPICEETLNPDATLMGPAQEQWLYESLDASQASWNVIAQQVFMAQRDFTAGADATYSMDAWDGYPVARGRLMQFLAQRRSANPIVLTGDVHANWVADLKVDFADPNSAIVGTEFIGTSISSGGDGVELSTSAAIVLAESPHVKFYNGRRGYVRCLVTPEQWHTDFRVVPYVTTPDAPISTRASFIVANGVPGAQPL